MRVLITAATWTWAVTLGAACYAPGLGDCRFVCGVDDRCPDGTVCSAGYCRSSSTGSCGGGGAPDSSSAQVVDSGAWDASGEQVVDSDVTCPASPCDGTPVWIADGCAVTCSIRSFASANATCGATGSGWRLAIVDSDVKRSAFKATFGNTRAWIGLVKTNGGATGWQWLTNPRQDQAIDLAAHPPWAANEPVATSLYAQLDTGELAAVLKTSPASAPAFCEYIP